MAGPFPLVPGRETYRLTGPAMLSSASETETGLQARLIVQGVLVGTQDVLFSIRSQRANTTPAGVAMHTNSPSR